MPKKASGTFDQTVYVKSYVKENIITKKVFFNRKIDQDMLEWIKDRNFSGYIKMLIRQDMEERPDRNGSTELANSESANDSHQKHYERKRP